MRRVAFMSTYGRNVGDEFVREGIRLFLDAAWGAYSPYYVDKHDPDTLHTRMFDEAEALHNKFEQADVIVQCGAPVYWNLPTNQCWCDGWAGSMWSPIIQFSHDRLVLNLGAGTCQPAMTDIDLSNLVDSPCACFANEIAAACKLTTVRDLLADRFLTAIKAAHHILPCPAFYAARRVCEGKALDMVAINLMPLGGHYRLKETIDADKWIVIITELLPRLRRRFKLLFVAHDADEVAFMRRFAHPYESVYMVSDYQDALRIYSQVAGVIANRIHAAIAVAGFGQPAVAIGNDSRLGTVSYIGIPAQDVSTVNAEWIESAYVQQADAREATKGARLALQESSAQQYIRLLRAL
jgi:hypothetical protein